MRTLKLAVRSQRWDLAAHTIVLATARRLKNGGSISGSERKKEKGKTERR